MRLGVLADVHGNLTALRAVLGLLAAEGVDAYLCAGDLVGYGAQPNECVELVAELGATCVAGNHDLMATGRLEDDGIGPLARDTLGWTAAALAPSTRAYLDALPLTVVAHDVLVAHGSVADPRTKIRTGAEAAGELERLAQTDPELGLLVIGHTHRPLAYGERRGRRLVRPGAAIAVPRAERHVLNPGAVGQARERRVLARCLVLDLDQRRAWFHAVSYEQAACDRALRAAGLPAGTYQLRPTPLRRRAPRYARRVLRSAAEAARQRK
jgi:putative phosphoesterase